MESSDHPSFTLFIDEAGDPGTKANADKSDPSKEWFVLAGLLVASDRSLEVVDWVRDMREAARLQTSNSPIHFRNLSEPNQERLCRMLSRKPARTFVVASHKTNMRGYQNKRMGKLLGRGEFYNWCIRLLLERASAWAVAKQVQNPKFSNCRIRVVFSQRGGHDYDHLKKYIMYILFQERTDGLFLKKRVIPSKCIRESELEVRPHGKVAGLQLADICASAFFKAVARGEAKFASELKPIVAIDPGNRTRADFGLSLWPKPHQGEIPEGDKAFFEAFGFKF